MKAHTDNPLVSVIVPNHNHAKYLPERLSSIINQTFQDFELIILDDASTDNSLEIISRCVGHLPHRLITNDENSGSVFRQWDKGISLAKGELIWIAESDDVADPGLLEKVVRKLVESGAALAYCQSLSIDSDGNVTGDLKYLTDEYSPDLWSSDFVVNGVYLCANYLAIMNVIPNASAVVFRRKFYIDPLTIIHHVKLIGDWALWAHIAMQGTVAFISEPLNKFRSGLYSVRTREEKDCFKDVIDLAALILEQTHAYEHKDGTLLIRHRLVSLWLKIGLEPASPFNWIKRRKAYRVLYNLYGCKLLLIILQDVPEHIFRRLPKKIVQWLIRQWYTRLLPVALFPRDCFRKLYRAIKGHNE